MDAHRRAYTRRFLDPSRDFRSKLEFFCDVRICFVYCEVIRIDNRAEIRIKKILIFIIFYQ